MRHAIIAAALMLAAGCVSVESTASRTYDFSKVHHVAVLEISGKVNGDAAKNELADMIAQQLLMKGYDVVERSQIPALLKEHEFQSGDLTDPADAVKAGRILNADAVVLANLPRADSRVHMTVKMLETETGKLLWIANAEGDSQRNVITIFSAVAGAAAGVLLGREVHDHTSAKVLGGVVGGVLGGVAGYALSPSEAELMRKFIRRTFEELPSRVPERAG